MDNKDEAIIGPFDKVEYDGTVSPKGTNATISLPVAVNSGYKLEILTPQDTTL